VRGLDKMMVGMECAVDFVGGSKIQVRSCDKLGIQGDGKMHWVVV
jgi:hypothetical protein